MPSPIEVAREHYAVRSRLVSAVAGEAGRLWRQVDPDRIGPSWLSLLTRLLVILTGAQRAAAGRADDYLDAVLAAQNVSPASRGRVFASALSGMASDGRDLAELLYRPVITTLEGIADGATVDRAMASGYATLDMIARTQVADAGRVADQVALTARPAATGYVRMVVGRTCSRCIVLAGQFYRWNAGFERHPQDDCVHIPTSEDTGDDVSTDPKAIFEGMTAAEQDKVFTVAGAQAIRDGADMNQVVNARRGMTTAAGASGRLVRNEAGLFTTTEGATRRGFAGQRSRREGRPGPRLMPESIYELAYGDRAEALSLLRLYGYLV
jgi:hypothetical protein